MLRANELMKRNIRALLDGRRLTQRDLAQWCRCSDSWLTKIMKEERREFPMKYWDKIADFFGISVYQLIQPGISMLTERRRGDRRSGRDRRVRNAAAMVHDRVPLARVISDEILRLDQSDLQILAAQIAELKRQRIGHSNSSESSTGSSINIAGLPSKKRGRGTSQAHPTKHSSAS